MARSAKAFLDLIVRANRFSKRLHEVNKTMRTVQERMESVARTARRMLLAAGAAATGATLAFATFEKEMSRVKALSGATDEEFQKLEEHARELGESTVFSAREAAQAMSAFALQGFKTQQIIAAMRPTLNLAAAGQLSMGEAAAVTAGIMRSMKLDAEDLGRVVDVLAIAATNSATDVSQLGEAMRAVGPVAQNAGMSLEETVAAIRAMSDVMIQGSAAGTALRNVLVRFQTETGEVKKAFKELGLTIEGTDGKMKPLADIVDELNAAMATMTDVERNATIAHIAGLRAIAGLTEILSLGGDKIREYTEQHKQLGVASKIAQIQMDNLYGAWKLLTSAATELAINIGEKLAPVLRGLASFFKGVIDFANRMNDTLMTVLVSSGFVASGLLAIVAVGPTVIKMFMGLETAFRAVAIAGLWVRKVMLTQLSFGMLKTALAGVPKLLLAVAGGFKAVAIAITSFALTPLGLLVTALTAVAAAAYLAKTRVAQLESQMREFQQLGAKFAGSWQGAMDAFKLAKGTDDLQMKYEYAKLAIERMEEAVEAIRQEWRAASESGDEFADVADTLEKKYKEAQRLLLGMRKGLEDVEAAVKKAKEAEERETRAKEKAEEVRKKQLSNIKKVIEELESEAQQLAMSTDQLQLWIAERNKATPMQLAYIKFLQKVNELQRKRAENEEKLRQKREEEARTLEELNTELAQLASGLEGIELELFDLENLRKAGKITQEVYEKRKEILELRRQKDLEKEADAVRETLKTQQQLLQERLDYLRSLPLTATEFAKAADKAKKDFAPDKEETTAGRFESLAALWQRITGAAARPNDPQQQQIQLAQATVTNTQQTATATKKTTAAVTKTATGIERLVAIVEEAIKQLPLVGAFG